GELPGPGNPYGFTTPVHVISDLPGGGIDEGRGMAEIVHDVAPAADLAFYTAFNGEADFAYGIQALADDGCKVIADDVIYFDEPYFQDGILAQSVDLAKKKGVTFFSSAGNQSRQSYESEYRKTNVEPLGAGSGTAHNFSKASDPARYYQPLYIPTGGVAYISLQWDQSSFSASGVGPATDIDMYLLNSNGNLVALSYDDNIFTGEPVEILGFQNLSASPTFYLVIVKYAGPDVKRLKYLMYDNIQFYLTNPPIPGIFAPTLVGHAKADGAIATAAAFYLRTPAYGVNPPLVESYSSKGGVANYLDIWGNKIPALLRKKPNLTAPDGGNTSFFPPFAFQDIPQDVDAFPNFFGTSAAAPHAAGAAALIIEAYGKKGITPTPNQVKDVLMSTAVDMDDPYTSGFDYGFDFETGVGLINVDKAVGKIKPPITSSAGRGVNAVAGKFEVDGDNPVLNLADVYPNPATRTFKLYLSLPNQQATNIELFSVDGRKLQTKTVYQSKGVVEMDASAYKPGVYLLNVKQGNFTKTIRVIKQ
ncbi:MAG: S8 family peptidase, partial [Ferruginibacter sp.]